MDAQLRSIAHRTNLLLLVCMVVACTRQRDSTAAVIDTREHSPKAASSVSTDRVPEADVRLAAFLRGALVTNARLGFDSLMACVPDGQTDRYVSLARYLVLGSAQVGDTVNAKAEVVTVAEETEDPHAVGRYVTTVRTRTDTLHWAMVRDSSSGKWGVCGYSKEGYGFGHYGSDHDTRWVPAGWSWERVRQTADSLQSGS